MVKFYKVFQIKKAKDYKSKDIEVERRLVMV